MKRSLVPALMLLTVIVLWQLLVQALTIPQYVLPAPTEIVAVIFGNGSLLIGNLLVTSEEVLLGFALAFAVSMLVGYLIAHVPSVRTALYPLIIGSQTIPVIAIAPLLIIWFGYNMLPKILVTALIAFFPMTINTVAGYLSIDEAYVKFFKTMKLSRWTLFRTLQWPAALPYIFAGAKVSATLSVIGATVGEWVGATQGLGHLIVLDTNQIDTARVFASIVLLAVMGLILFGLVALAERLMVPWRRKAT